MNIRTLCFLIICAAAFGACKESITGSQEISVPISDLFPLQVGNDWNYRDLGYYKSGLRIDTINFHIREKSVYQGNPAFEFIAFNDTSTLHLFYYSGSNDLFAKPRTEQAYLILHSPLKLNEEFILIDSTDGGLTRNRSVLILRNTNEQITVPAGTFNCFHFDRIDLTKKFDSTSFDTTSVFKIFLAKNVGQIMQLNYYPQTPTGILGLTEKQELINYTIK